MTTPSGLTPLAQALALPQLVDEVLEEHDLKLLLGYIRGFHGSEGRGR
jgi:hypothetical protein